MPADVRPEADASLRLPPSCARVSAGRQCAHDLLVLTQDDDFDVVPELGLVVVISI
jgi:hypothetical protein